MTCPICSALVRMVHHETFHNGGTVTLFACLNGHSKREVTEATQPRVGEDEIIKDERRRAQISASMTKHWERASPEKKKAQGAALAKKRWPGTPRVGQGAR